MKLTEEYFFPEVTEAGAKELYSFADSIIFRAGRNLPLKDIPDIRQEMVLKCLEKLSEFDRSKGVILGGYLYWQCRGVISVWANRHRREIPYSEEMVEYIKSKPEAFREGVIDWKNM